MNDETRNKVNKRIKTWLLIIIPTFSSQIYKILVSVWSSTSVLVYNRLSQFFPEWMLLSLLRGRYSLLPLPVVVSDTRCWCAAGVLRCCCWGPRIFRYSFPWNHPPPPMLPGSPIFPLRSAKLQTVPTFLHFWIFLNILKPDDASSRRKCREKRRIPEKNTNITELWVSYLLRNFFFFHYTRF